MINTKAIFNIKTEEEFLKLALEVFKFQFENNPVYRSFCDLLYKHPSDVNSIREIPFLPIQFFRSHQVLSTKDPIQQTFTSSGTTETTPSKHFVTDLKIYEQSFLKCFEMFYGNIEDHIILALLPSYLERKGSSLVYMVDHLIKKSNHPESRFYLNDLKGLSSTLERLDNGNQKTILIGVSFLYSRYVGYVSKPRPMFAV